MLIRVEVRFIGELPFRLPVPPRIEFESITDILDGARISFEDFEVPRPPEESRASNIDDGMGNYLRSRVHLHLITTVDYDESSKKIDMGSLQSKVLTIVNNFVDACRYVGRDPRIFPIAAFPSQAIYQIYINNHGISLPLEVNVTLDSSPISSPFGLSLPTILDADRMNAVAAFFSRHREVNPAWLLWVDAKRDAYFVNVKRCILNLNIALEIHIENLIDQYRSKLPLTFKADDVNSNKIYSHYDKDLTNLVGTSLHSHPELFKTLEYLRVLRNNIAHKWMAKFEASALDSNRPGGHRSRYLADHVTRDGHEVTGSDELHELTEQTKEILEFVDSLFAAQYP